MDNLIKIIGSLIFILKAKNVITSDEYDLITQKITPEEFNDRLNNSNTNLEGDNTDG